jgi:transposase
MSQAVADLPEDVESLRVIIAAQATELADANRRLHTRDTLIEKLKAQLALLRRARFGASSEKVEREIAQLELALEDIESSAIEAAPPPFAKAESEKAKPARQPLQDHLPRFEEVHEIGDCACPTCGGRDFLKAGSVVSEVLDYIPASFRVVRHVRRRMVCKGCDTEIKAAMPSPPIERGKPGAGLLAHVLVAKYGDHLPLYRQSGIYARENVELSRSTMAHWVGQVSAGASNDGRRDMIARSPDAGRDDGDEQILVSGGDERRQTRRIEGFNLLNGRFQRPCQNSARRTAHTQQIGYL